MIRTSSEHEAQVALFEWAALNEMRIPELSLLFAIPNGGARHVAVGRKMKLEGVKRGVPDVMLAVARKPFHGLFIELKREDLKPKKPGSSGGVSEDQWDWHMRLMKSRYCVRVCYGFEEAISSIMRYLSVVHTIDNQ